MFSTSHSYRTSLTSVFDCVQLIIEEKFTIIGHNSHYSSIPLRKMLLFSHSFQCHSHWSNIVTIVQKISVIMMSYGTLLYGLCWFFYVPSEKCLNFAGSCHKTYSWWLVPLNTGASWIKIHPYWLEIGCEF